MKKFDMPVAGTATSHGIASMTSDKQLKEKKSSTIRPLSINQVQRIVNKDADKTLLENINGANSNTTSNNPQ